MSLPDDPSMQQQGDLTDGSDAATREATEFLRQCLATQTDTVQRYLWRDLQVWVKRSVRPRPRWHFWLLGIVASVVRLPALAPVYNPGGQQAVRTEARRLRELAARGLRVPPVLAELPDGFLMEHMGRPGRHAPSLAEEMNENKVDHPETVLSLFVQGLHATSRVHAVGTCLSQGFARNLVHCPDGVIGYVDFEDDPQATMPMAQCQLRDILCYVHSSAVYLLEAGQLDAARGPWLAWLAERPVAVQALVSTSASRMRWLRFLPRDRRWGRDLQRARAAWELLEG